MLYALTQPGTPSTPRRPRPSRVPFARRLSQVTTIATRQALIAAGWSPGAVKAAIRHKRWQRLNEHVVCLHTGPLTADETLQAVLASCPARCGLAGLTAVGVHGVTGFGVPDVHVLVAAGTRVLPVEGVKIVVHQVRWLAATDIVRRRGLAVTPIARSLVDAAAWSGDAGTGARILAAGVQQRKVRPVDLERELARRGWLRHGAVLRPFVADLAGGAQALSEVAFLRFCRRHGFPRPEMNVRSDASGRRRYLDAVFRLPDGRLVRAEIDGGVHLSLTQRLRDVRNDNDDVISRRATLRFLSIQIYDDDPVAIDQLGRALRT